MSCSRVNLEQYLISLEEINIATEDFSPKRCIGGGGFGKVYIGELSERWQSRTAAIKRLDQDSYQGEREFRNELEMISRFHHENIISFIGYCDESGEMIIVYDYATNGSVDHHLQDPNKRRCITWTQRLKICLGAAKGLDYLHTGLEKHKRVIHRDVKSANILLDKNFTAKVCDFGLSKAGPRNRPNTEVYTRLAGTHSYMDPDYRESGILRKESDVYSFGVVLFEMLSGMLVYCPRTIGDDRPQSLMNLVRRYYYNKEVENLIDPDIRDEIEKRSFDKFTEIAYECINLKFEERPTMEKVVDRIKEALNSQLQENIATRAKKLTLVFECVMEDMGFSHGKPCAAFTIYKCLLHWKYLETESTTIFNQIIQIITSATEDEDVKNYNNKMAYWISVASTLLFLVHQSIKVTHSQKLVSKPAAPPISAPSISAPPTSRFKRMTMKFRSSEASSVPKAVHISETKAELKLEIVPKVVAGYPANHFGEQLKISIENMYGIIADNLENELRSLLDLCFEAPPPISTVLRSGEPVSIDSDLEPWQAIVYRLCTLLKTLKEKFVPPAIARRIFSQIYSYINAELFNGLMVRRNCCTFTNRHYMKAGLKCLLRWCPYNDKEYEGSALHALHHIRQAINLLVIDEIDFDDIPEFDSDELSDFDDIGLDDITSDLCSVLNTHQIYRLCTIRVEDDDKQRTHTVFEDLISKLRKGMTEDGDANNNIYILKDCSRYPFSADRLSDSLKVKDFENIKVVVELAKYRAFKLKMGTQYITFGQVTT